MADIDVTFGAPGAANAARDADRFAASTAKGGAAAQRASATGKAHSATLRESAIAARSAAAAQEELGRATDRAASKGLRWSQIARSAGVGRAFRSASAVGGALESVGIAGAAGGGVALAVVGAFELLKHAIMSQVEAYDLAKKGIAELVESQRKAKEALGESGMKGAAFESQARRMVATGGTSTIDMAIDYAGQHGLKESMEAATKAFDMFGPNAGLSLQQAHLASSVTGDSLSKSVEAQRGMGAGAFSHGNLVAQSVAGMSLGHALNPGELDGMLARVNASTAIGHMSSINSMSNMKDIADLSRLPQGADLAAKQLSDYMNPQAAENRKNQKKAADEAEASHGVLDEILELLKSFGLEEGKAVTKFGMGMGGMGYGSMIPSQSGMP